MRERERKRVIDFDSDAKHVWYEINIRYRKLSGSKQYDMTGDVYWTVLNTINDIVEKCGPLASAHTRFNGLSVLRKIGKTIVLSSTDVVGHEVQKDFGRGEELEDGMLKIVNSMKSDEIDAIRFDESSDEALWPKLLELRALALGYCIFERLDDVLGFLDAKAAEREDAYDVEDKMRMRTEKRVITEGVPLTIPA